MVAESAALENQCTQIFIKVYDHIAPYLLAPYNGILAYLELMMFQASLTVIPLRMKQIKYED